MIESSTLKKSLEAVRHYDDQATMKNNDKEKEDTALAILIQSFKK